MLLEAEEQVRQRSKQKSATHAPLSR